MKSESWKELKKKISSLPTKETITVREPEEGRKRLCALVVDSPWLPGFAGISHFDYYAFPDQWLKANLFIEERFPDLIFIPGFWVEYGMATEPSAFGCKISWRGNSPPSIHPTLHDISEVSRLKIPSPDEDGFMPFVLNIYKYIEKSLKGTGHHIKIVAARGPLAIAAHLRGFTELLIDLKLYPVETKRLLEITTKTVIRWLQAQIDNLSEVEGVLVLDDIVGFLSPEDYLEFAAPYLKEIFSSFRNFVKIYHNDSKISHLLGNLADVGFHVLNFSHTLDISEVYSKVGDRMLLMGNIPPLEVLVEGTPEEVKSYALGCIHKTGGGRSLILSAGGGVSPGTPAENIDALVEVIKLTNS
jgi:uroporphyrinogen decarboxylase